MKKIFLSLAFLLIVHCTLNIDNCICQWVQQTLPVSGQIYDMLFFDANTGIISMNTTPPYILRTTNGGTNWNIIANIRVYFLDKVDSSAVYGNGNVANNNAIFRSYDRGLTWDSTDITNYNVIQSIAFFNRDTGLISGYNGNVDVIWKTTNGGRSMSLISTQTGWGRLFMLKDKKYNNEYYGFHISNQTGGLSKTTNSGLNWINVPNTGTYSSISFLNKDTGWTYIVQYPSRIMYTSNGGSNWVTQYIDSNNSYSRIHFENKDKGWAGPNVFNRIFATSNGGITWGTQVTPIYDGMPFPNSFVDSLVGWIGLGGNTIAKTTNGGGPIIFTNIHPVNTETPNSFTLFQNYPNPFNPQTTIEFSLPKSAKISLNVFDIEGKEISIIYNNEPFNSGNYNVTLDFSRTNLPSGIYFYRLLADGIPIASKKMLYLK